MQISGLAEESMERPGAERCVPFRSNPPRRFPIRSHRVADAACPSIAAEWWCADAACSHRGESWIAIPERPCDDPVGRAAPAGCVAICEGAFHPASAAWGRSCRPGDGLGSPGSAPAADGNPRVRPVRTLPGIKRRGGSPTAAEPRAVWLRSWVRRTVAWVARSSSTGHESSRLPRTVRAGVTGEVPLKCFAPRSGIGGTDEPRPGMRPLLLRRTSGRAAARTSTDWHDRARRPGLRTFGPFAHTLDSSRGNRNATSHLV
jgi:hypothetical protein